MTRSFIGKEHIKPDTGWVVDLPTHLGSTFPTQLGFKPVDEPSTCCDPPLCYLNNVADEGSRLGDRSGRPLGTGRGACVMLTSFPVLRTMGRLAREGMTLKKSELYSSLWSSCDELRG